MSKIALDLALENGLVQLTLKLESGFDLGGVALTPQQAIQLASNLVRFATQAQVNAEYGEPAPALTP